ncbi:MAG TPA: bifunctional glutamate N-acetyltransferase/amino-acid acetyltransferase ArgJ [Terriglobales bacterium]|nr:bifunctional glutamate N-acetyltransferase/amino-acid acetyltransferase ArgJ [Terriglobales bacterium]
MKVDVELTPVTVPGFRFAGVKCGIKESGKHDVALIYSEVPAAAAAEFTTNRVKAAPVRVGIERMRSGRLQAVVINSGNANAYTGANGLKMAREMCAIVAKSLRLDERLVIPSSTGRIGVQLPAASIRRGVKQACAELSADGFHRALEGIMTTDAFPKFAVEQLELEGRQITIAGMAKGAGMIAPKMAPPHATLLSYILTDAAVAPAALARVLSQAQPESFNAVVVDGDTSTNDTVVVMANGVAGNTPLAVRSRAFAGFAQAVTGVMAKLARMVVKDGEGATKIVDIRVINARNPQDAAKVADTIARSPLCKTAFFGGDPYSGRIVCAAGYSGAVFDPERLNVFFDDVPVVQRGIEVVGKREKRAAAAVAKPEFVLTIDLSAGKASARRLASDLTGDYVKFNSDYRT